MAKKAQTNAMGIVSLVLGIVSILFCWVGFISFPAGVVGIILAILQRKKFKNGVATAGLITSIVGLILTILVWVFFSLFWLALTGATY